MEKYEAPQIEDIGTVADLTKGEATGTVTDADFPAGTPVGDFTFS